MSCSVVIPTVIPGDALSIGMLFEGVRQLGLAMQEIGHLLDEKGHPCKVDHVIINEAGDRIGLTKGPDGNLQIVVANAEKGSVRKTVDQVKQAYARLKTLDQANRQGFQKVKEEKLPDGSIRIVVQKWR